ncbi:MAG: DNA polymerase III subunit delta [Gemmatimonadaceae bacterium]|nr:DNA polymerase III subunit delta [Gemmatimonadaceae bacterium]
MSSKDITRQFMSQIKDRAFAPAYLFWGDDEWRKDAALRELLRGAVDPASRDFNLDQLRGPDLDADNVSTLLGTPPMMADRRVVVIRDVSGMKKGARAALEKYLAKPSSDVVLALTVPSGAKPDATLTNRCFTLQINAVSGEELSKWITKQTSERFGAQITPDAVALLQSAVGDDAATLMMELDKAASYVLGGTIDKAAIEAVVGVRHGETSSDLLDAVAARDVTQAVKLVGPVLALPKTTGVGLAMALATQTAALGWGAAQRAKGVPLNRLAKDYFDLLKRTGAFPGRPWGEAAAAWTKHVPTWTVAEAESGLRAILRADERLKDTRASNDEQVLSSLVLELCTSAGQRRA